MWPDVGPEATAGTVGAWMEFIGIPIYGQTSRLVLVSEGDVQREEIQMMGYVLRCQMFRGARFTFWGYLNP